MAVTKEDLREKLLREREELLEEIDALGVLHAREMGEFDTQRYSNHMADIATETYEQEANLALETNLRRQLQLVESALRRYDEGSYGICTNCGEQIPMERLEVLPEATLCVRCKTEQEAQH